MCDTLVAVPTSTADGSVWFGKNSDREPGEAQVVEHLPRKTYNSPSTLRCTYLELKQASRTNEVMLSRPFWMWGAEMGVNEHGLAIGNEAVFTRLPVPETGLTGMDLLRLALERTESAGEALEFIARLIVEPGQGGLCGYRHRRFRYHNAFIIADPAEAWVLETAGPHWAAQRVRGVRTISNALSIGRDFDLISPDAYSFARSKGWSKSANDFDFARAFGHPSYTRLSGGAERAACTLDHLRRADGRVGRDELFAALTDHAGRSPREGWRMRMPCAHASWWRTRQAGQTTGSMVSCLRSRGSTHWLTGTSSPCLSVFKPARLSGELLSTGPRPGGGYDSESLFWRHERLHRLTLVDYSTRKAFFDKPRKALQEKIISAVESSGPDAHFQEFWDEHRDVIPDWISRVETASGKSARPNLFNRYWAAQREQDSMP